jgi:hypothetical protein
MNQLIEATKISLAQDDHTVTMEEIQNCSSLELGNLLLFSQNTIEFSDQEIQLLETVSSKVVYNIKSGKMFTKDPLFADAQLKPLFIKYLDYVKKNLQESMPHYISRADLCEIILYPRNASALEPKLNFAMRSDGNRLLTFFTNMSNKSLLWSTASENFSHLAKKFIEKNVSSIPSQKGGETLREKIARKMKVKIRDLQGSRFKSPYDRFMLKMIKEIKSASFKNEFSMLNWQIQAKNSVLFFSDAVLHSALENQTTFAVTIHLPRYLQLNPEKSPLSVLERLSNEVMMEPFLKQVQ